MSTPGPRSSDTLPYVYMRDSKGKARRKGRAAARKAEQQRARARPTYTVPVRRGPPPSIGMAEPAAVRRNVLVIVLCFFANSYAVASCHELFV
jgi:hypothetical protein